MTALLGGRTFIIGAAFLLATTYQLWLAMSTGIAVASMGMTIGVQAGGVATIIAGNISSKVQPDGKRGWRKLALGLLYCGCATFLTWTSIHHGIAQADVSAAMVSQVAGLGAVVWGNIKEKNQHNGEVATKQ